MQSIAFPVRRSQPRAIATGSVTASLGYLHPGCARPVNYMYEPPAGTPWENCRYDQVEVRIRDARPVAPSLSIDREGFELWDAPTRVQDFLSEQEVREVYYPEVEEILCTIAGASRAHVFDHLVRKREPGRPALTFGRRGQHRYAGAAGQVHNDYTLESGTRRLGMVLADPQAQAGGARYSIVNLWRSISHPVLDTPLALCDARTVAPADLVATDILYPNRTGEIFTVLRNPRHEWSYFPAMTRDEILVFKQFDSRDAGVARFTPHAAFDHPHVPADAPLRESIEIRCLLVYEEPNVNQPGSVF